MLIPFLSFFGKKDAPKYFLVLLLRHEKVQAVLLEEHNGTISVKAKEEVSFANSIEHVSDGEFLAHLDEAISKAESILSVNIPTHKTVFGVKPDWSEETRIKKQHLLRLKKACDALGLSPVGFLVIPEAIVHRMKQEEGIPISTILIEVGKKTMFISLVKAGRVLETKSVPIEGSCPSAADELLKQFENAEIFPSRITLFNDDRNEDTLLQEFIGHTWSTRLPFLHVPQITSLPKNFGVEAVVSASATQMGFEVLESAQEEVTQPTPIPSENNSSPKQFGFIQETDVALTQTDGQDDSEEQITAPSPPPPKKTSLFKKTLLVAKNLYTQGLTMVHGKKFPTILHVSFNFPSGIIRHPKLIIALAIPLVVLCAGAWLYLYGLKATATVTIAPEIIKQTEDITFSSTADSNPSSRIVLSSIISVSQQGSSSTQTTGKKEIGEKAKGTVTIFGRFSEEKTLPKGTLLVSSNNLEFTLDGDARLASTSADASTEPSTAKASITARAIGKEANLPSNEKFSVGDFDTSIVVGKNDSAFSGGSKKEIRVVSEKDIQKLTDGLPKQLEQKAREDAAKKVSDGETVLPTFVKHVLVEKKFNKKTGEESDVLNLQATVEYTGISYQKNQLQDIALALLQNQIPTNLSIVTEGMKKEIQKVSIKNADEIAATISFTIPLLPKIDAKELAKKLAGREITDAEDILLGLPAASDAKIKITPRLPVFGNKLPIRFENITIQSQIAND